MSEENNELNTLVGKHSFIKGKISIKNSLRVDGRVVGDIKSTGDITVGPEGEIEGNVQAQSVICGGRIKGGVIAENKIILEEKSVMIGDVQAKIINMHEGAMFDGSCQIINSSSKSNHSVINK